MSTQTIPTTTSTGTQITPVDMKLEGVVRPVADAERSKAVGAYDDLAEALRRAAEAHGGHEARNGGEYDDEWPDWYAAYVVADQAPTELPA